MHYAHTFSTRQINAHMAYAMCYYDIKELETKENWKKHLVSNSLPRTGHVLRLLLAGNKSRFVGPWRSPWSFWLYLKMYVMAHMSLTVGEETTKSGLVLLVRILFISLSQLGL